MATRIPLPIGVTSRPLPDRYASYLSGSHMNQNGVGGQNSYIGVFNNATDGTVLRIYAVSLFSATGQFVFFEWVAGNPGVAYTADGAYGVIDPRTYTTPGQAIVFNSAVCVGQHMGALFVNSTTGGQFSPGYPIAIIPPNYSFLCQGKNLGVGVEGSIWWLPFPGPLTPRL